MRLRKQAFLGASRGKDSRGNIGWVEGGRRCYRWVAADPNTRELLEAAAGEDLRTVGRVIAARLIGKPRRGTRYSRPFSRVVLVLATPVGRLELIDVIEHDGPFDRPAVDHFVGQSRALTLTVAQDASEVTVYAAPESEVGRRQWLRLLVAEELEEVLK